MKHRNVYGIVSAVAFALPLMVGTALGGDKISSTIVETPGHAGDFHLTKPGNSLTIAPAPASQPGQGLVMKLKLKNVDCVLEGNDKSIPGKCGVVGTGVDAVLDVVLHVSGTDYRVGVPIEFVKGQARFIVGDTTKIGGPQAFGALVPAGTPVGFDAIKIREEGSNPADCATIPLLLVNGCVDGNEFAVTGITTSP